MSVSHQPVKSSQFKCLFDGLPDLSAICILSLAYFSYPALKQMMFILTLLTDVIISIVEI